MGQLKCVICGKEISGRYVIDGWGNCACAEHEHKLCCSCFRIIGRYSTLSKVSGQFGFKVDDERSVCGLCQETCINSTSDMVKSYDFIRDLLSKAGIQIVKEGVKEIKIITKGEMEKKSKNAQGLCCTTTYADPKKSTSRIYILNGLPKIQFESVLAHELLHYWLFYNGIEDGEFTEGFCNIGSALVLNYYVARKGSDLAEHLRKYENDNPDYYYGVKFLVQKKKLQRMGWKNYIQDILTRKKITP